jgi:hypothetical protein
MILLKVFIALSAGNKKGIDVMGERDGFASRIAAQKTSLKPHTL